MPAAGGMLAAVGEHVEGEMGRLRATSMAANGRSHVTRGKSNRGRMLYIFVVLLSIY